MPHDPHHAFRRVAYRLDDAVFGKCPSLERWSCLRRAKIMVAVDLRRLAIDGNNLPWRDVACDTFKSDAEAVLDHLHPAAYAQKGQNPFFRNIDQNIFRGVAFRRIAAIVREVISAG